MKLSKKINLLMRYLENGLELKTKTGHTLVIAEGQTEPGFSATSYNCTTKEESDIVYQIGSDVAWMFLIQHAKEMTENDAFMLAANATLTNYNRKDRNLKWDSKD